MKAYILISIAILCFYSTECNAQWWGSVSGLNPSLLHQLVGNSKTENSKQVSVKNEQRKSAAIEENNRGFLKTVKGKYRTLQERFAKMSVLFDAANIGISATPLVREIIAQQQQIVIAVNKDPALVQIAMDSEVLFVKRANSLVNYLIGLCAVIGDLNQMKVSDRRILFQYILDELQEISYMSGGVSRSLQAAVIKSRGVDPFSDYVNNETRLVDEIMNNAKILTQ